MGAAGPRSAGVAGPSGGPFPCLARFFVLVFFSCFWYSLFRGLGFRPLPWSGPALRAGRVSLALFFAGCVVVPPSFSLVSSRSLVAPGRGLGGVPLSAPWWRRVVGLGLASGALRWRVRSSARSFSGAVVVVGFACPSRAAAFAASLAGWCGCAVAVRRFAGAAGPVWGVSVPVAVPPGLALGPGLPPSSAASWVR